MVNKSQDWEALKQTLPETEAWHSVLLTQIDQSMVPKHRAFTRSVPGLKCYWNRPTFNVSQLGKSALHRQLRIQHQVEIRRSLPDPQLAITKSQILFP